MIKWALCVCLLHTVHCFYFTNEKFEPLEQQYETNESDESEYSNSNSEQQQQQSQVQPQQTLQTLSSEPSSTETLQQAYSQLAQSQVKTYDPDTGSSTYSATSQSYYGGGGNGGGYESKGGMKSESPLSQITQIPSGSMFALGEKGTGSLEYESPFAKQPYSIVFRTHSMPVKIQQQHQTLPAPEVEFVRSQEEAHRIKHEVIRPVIQEVHEIIQPYRRVVQEVRPVIENVHTVVSKGDGRGGNGGSDGGSKYNAGSGSGGGKYSSRSGSFGSGGSYGNSGYGMAGSYSEVHPRVEQYRVVSSSPTTITQVKNSPHQYKPQYSSYSTRIGHRY